MLLLVILMLPMVLMFSVIGGTVPSVYEETPSYSEEYGDSGYSDDSGMYSETGYDSSDTFQLLDLSTVSQSQENHGVSTTIAQAIWESSPTDGGIMMFSSVDGSNIPGMSFQGTIDGPVFWMDCYKDADSVADSSNVYGGPTLILIDGDAVRFLSDNYDMSYDEAYEATMGQLDRISRTTDSTLHYVLIVSDLIDYTLDGETDASFTPHSIISDGVWYVEEQRMALINEMSGNSYYWYDSTVPMEQRTTSLTELMDSMNSEDAVYTDADGNVIDPDEASGQIFVGERTEFSDEG